MSDILADYREWRSQQEERIGTHSPECHLWPRHERCMIHRLADELERARAALVAVAAQDGTLSVSDGNVTVTVDATLTPEEREALHHVVGDVADITGQVEDTLRGLLERMK